MELKTLFDPRTVAIIGADNNPKKVGYALMKNVLAGGAREVYPVTLGDTQVLGRATYTSLSAIPGDVALAIIAVRADIVPTIVRECAAKGIKHVVVISAGFKEAGEQGAELERELSEIAREHGIALLGPNCLGVMNAHTDWNASFAVNKPLPGHISFISQSGALGTALLDWATTEGVGISTFVSLGNEASLTELEFLEYAADDEQTRAVLLYLEKVSDGPRFRELAARVTARKPLVVLRAGRSPRGSRAVASHTGSLAPQDAILGAALREIGAISVDSVRELFSVAKLLALGHTTPLRNLVVLTNGGGPSVNTADLIDLSSNLALAEFDDATKEALAAALPPMAAVGNPIDVIGDAGPERYESTLRVLAELPNVDAIIALVTPQMMTDPVGIAEVLLAYREKKPLIPVFMGGNAVAPGVSRLREAGMVSFDSPSDVVLALRALAQQRGGEPATRDGATRANVSPRLSTELSMMPLREMQELLTDYDLPLEGVFVANESEVAGALHTLGNGPFAMKAISQELVHKSDLRAVELNIPDAEAASRAWGAITAHVADRAPGAHIDGMLIQRMVRGVECIIGMKRDAVFGPVIVFGLGGIFVEILKDSSLRIAPVSKEEALLQIREIKGLPLLTGARGREPVDIDALANDIAALSHLALDHPNIEEIDFNPVFALPQGLAIVDARLMVRA